MNAPPTDRKSREVEMRNKAWNETVLRLQSQIEGLKIELSNTARVRDALQTENTMFKSALIRIHDFPVHSEPVGGALEMQDIAYKALTLK